MNNKGFFALIILFIPFSLLYGQNFNYDNTAYQTLSWTDFFDRIEKNNNIVFFDVRTPGERADTAHYLNTNQGKIKGAFETDFFDFEAAYPTYLKYKTDTIYLYCSHSRRSRLLAKRLADSAFKCIVSINGGMSHLNSLSDKDMPLKKKYLTSNLPYSFIAPIDFAQYLKNTKYQIVDVRPDTVFNGQSSIQWENLFGNVPNVLHIPLNQVDNKIHLLNKNKIIILFDNEGEIAPSVAQVLSQRGYQVRILFAGLDNLTYYLPYKKRAFIQSKYQCINPIDLPKWLDNDKNIVIDVRTPSEFANRDSVQWKNMGRLKKSINIPFDAISEETLKPYKEHNILIYDIMMHDELFEVTQKLEAYGIKYTLLYGGMYGVRWFAHNTKYTYLKEIIDYN